MKGLERIRDFCDFEQFLPDCRAMGNVRLKGSARHSGDMIAIGQPVILTIKSLTVERTLCSLATYSYGYA